MRLGDSPLEELSLAALRRRIVVSEQEPILFSGELRAQLDPWRRASSDDAVLAALAVANAQDVLDALPEGLDATIDERGRSFSGGQRQRLVLARALLADPEILVLVEPTSAVDAHTEARIARDLRAARDGRTTVIVTTSPLVLDRADRVVLVEEGRVAAEGTHRELLGALARVSRRRHARRERVTELLPIADGPELRRHARRLAGRHRGPLVGVVVLHALAAAAGLVAPALLGRLVQAVSDGTTRVVRRHQLIVVLAGAIVLQTILTWFARRASFVVSELIFAELREDFMRRVLALPLSTVERAGTGDLVSRTTADVDSLARTIRFAIPETLIAGVTTVLTVAAALWVSPPAALALVAGAPAIVIGTRWYLKRAPQGYLRERAAYATMAGTVGETVDGGLTVESLGLNEHRVRRVDEDLTEAYSAERYTLRLRTFWFPSAEIAYVLPVVAGLLWGGWLVHAGHASIGEVTAVVLYAQALADPVDRLISWLDEIQVGGASLARLVGIESVPPDRVSLGPLARRGRARGARRALRVRPRAGRAARDRPRPAAGRACRRGRAVGRGQVDPRPAARRHPPAPHGDGRGRRRRSRRAAARDAPAGGRAHHAGAARLRRHAGRQPAARASGAPRATELEGALAAVDALEWAEALPEGLETTVGAGGEPLTPPQTQQLALARLVLADPHTLVLDEATSLLDPRAARHLERSLAAVLEGRTVVAIAHRLHTAHDADRVAVVEDGLLGELGTHDELLEDGGAYAALWESWRS